RNSLHALPYREVRFGEVGRTADQIRQHRAVRVQRLQRRFARGDRLGFRRRLLNEFLAALHPILRQLAVLAALELRGQIGMRLAIRGEAFIPLAFGRGSRRARVPGVIDLARYDEGLIAPTELLARGRDFIRTERRAVRRFLALLVGCAESDDGLAANQRRPILLRARLEDRLLDRVGAVAVDAANDMPAVRFEALRRI